ncbi:MAG: tyrosine-type recombinase/integrase [Methylobacter sp.]
MAKPQKIKNKNGSISYRIFISNNGKRESKTFSTSRMAQDWADKRQREIERALVHGEESTLTIKQVIDNYIERFGSGFGKSKGNDLVRLSNYALAKIDVKALTAKHLIDHCIERNKEAKPQTVSMDLSTLKTALSTMSAVDGFDFDMGVFERAIIVLKRERMIANTTKRTRVPTWVEMLKLTRHFRRQKKSQTPMAEIMWFAYFSTRRLAEITRLEWADNNDDRQTGMVRDAKHPREKKGNHRRFKYEKSAWKVAQRQPRTSAFIFPYNSGSISVLFNSATKSLGIKDLHFHDLRHAGATRLFSRGYSIEQVQQFTLHIDWRVLSRYTHIKPEDIN